jgi:hypothetical protein
MTIVRPSTSVRVRKIFNGIQDFPHPEQSPREARA